RGVVLFAAAADRVSNLRDAAVRYRHVGVERVAAGAIDDSSVANDEIEHRVLLKAHRQLGSERAGLPRLAVEAADLQARNHRQIRGIAEVLAEEAELELAGRIRDGRERIPQRVAALDV